MRNCFNVLPGAMLGGLYKRTEMPSLFVSTELTEKVQDQLTPFSDLQEIYALQPLQLANGDPNAINIDQHGWQWSLL